jgi:hypothetical protein
MDNNLKHLGKRIKDLNDKGTQVLLFLSFAIAAAVLLWSNKPSSINDFHQNLLLGAIHPWVWAIFPTLVVILPLREIRENNLRWYTFIRRLKFVALWMAIILIFWGAVDFARAI